MSERRAKANSPKTRRYELKRRQNQDRFVILGQARQAPDDWVGGDRRRGGVESDTGLLRGTAGTRPLMPREKLKRRNPRGESTDARDWDGPIRKSVEGPVMGSEQRDRVRQSCF